MGLLLKYFYCVFPELPITDKQAQEQFDPRVFCCIYFVYTLLMITVIQQSNVKEQLPNLYTSLGLFVVNHHWRYITGCREVVLARTIE